MRKLLVAVLLLLVAVPSMAQRKKKKKEEEKVPVYNYVIDDPMDKFGRQPAALPVIYFHLMPEFYRFMEAKKDDTLIRYECYNPENKLIKPDTLKDFTQMRYISAIYHYEDRVNKYRDTDGVWKPLPVERIMFRYDKMGDDKWMTVDYHTNKSAFMQEFPKEIVNEDTVTVIDPVIGTETMLVYRYYKVVPMDKK